MVVTHNFLDLFKACSELKVVNLPTLKEHTLQLRYEESDDIVTVYGGAPPALPFAESEIFEAPISASKRLTAVDGDCKAVYEVTFDITGSNISFKPGDTIGIIPHNESSSVNFILEHLNLTSRADLSYQLTCDTSQKGAKIPPHIPIRSTLRNVLTNCVDLRCVLKKLFLLSLSRHTKEEDERKVLEYLCSKEGSTAYTSHILNKNISILDLLSIFKSCKPPIEVLLSNLPRLLPRPYSIANSHLQNPNILKICFSVMHLENGRKGLTTSWLEQLILNDNIEMKMKNLNLSENCNKVPIYLRKNNTGFTMPDVETSLILIGPGTGIAPFIGFLEERKHLTKNRMKDKLGDVWVFFGCRNPKLDFIYEDELKSYLDDGVLNRLSTAFSRVDDSDAKYVQDAIQQNGELLAKWIHDGASVFICGDVKNVTPEVKMAFQKCFIKHGDSESEATTLLSEMIASKRYVVDIWS